MANYVFPKVDLKKQPRTNYDLSHTIRTSFAPCLSIPIMDIETVPGDSFYLKMQSLIESMPMVAPTLGRWKASFKFFINPMSNIYGWMDNNEKLTTSEWLNRSCHCFRLPIEPRIDVQDSVNGNRPLGVAAGSLFNYLGFPVGYVGYGWSYVSDQVITHNESVFNAEGLLTYLDIVRNYCINNQEMRVPFVMKRENTSSFEDDGINLQASIKYYDVSTLDLLFKLIRMNPNGLENIFDDNWMYNFTSDNDNAQKLKEFLYDLSFSCFVPLGGLACVPYLMDFNRGIMNATVGEVEAEVSVIDGKFSIPQLQIKNKEQHLVNLLDLSGGRFADILHTVWQSKIKGGVDKPIFVGSRSEYIYMTDIISTATTGASDSPNTSTLGQQGGFAAGRTRNENKAVCNFEFGEYGRFMCIFQLMPDVDYSAGISLNLLKREFSDKYIPQYSQIGYQDVSDIELNSIPSGLNYSAFSLPSPEFNGAPIKVGSRIAWSEYMCQIDKCFGHFAQGGELDYWTLLRRYRYSDSAYVDAPGSSLWNLDFTTYAYPFLFNYLFVDQSLNAQNFRLQCFFNIKAKRPFPKRSMPRL